MENKCLFKSRSGIEFLDVSMSVIGQPVAYFVIVHPKFKGGLMVGVFVNNGKKQLDVFKGYENNTVISDDDSIFEEIKNAIDEFTEYNCSLAKDVILKKLKENDEKKSKKLIPIIINPIKLRTVQ